MKCFLCTIVLSDSVQGLCKIACQHREEQEWKQPKADHTNILVYMCTPSYSMVSMFHQMLPGKQCKQQGHTGCLRHLQTTAAQ